MRKVLISLAAAGLALAFATPAAAQYYPAPQPYGNAYGYNNYGQVRSLQVRIDNLQRRIEVLRDRRLISRNEANGLRSDARELERRLRFAGRNGLNFIGLSHTEEQIKLTLGCIAAVLPHLEDNLLANPAAQSVGAISRSFS